MFGPRGGAEEPLSGPTWGDKVHGLPPEHPTLPSLLQAAGCATALIGKWQLGPAPAFGPQKSGYGECFGYRPGGIDYFSHRNPRGAPDLWRGDERANRAAREPDRLAELRSAWQQWNEALPAIPANAQVHLAFDATVLPKSTH